MGFDCIIEGADVMGNKNNRTKMIRLFVIFFFVALSFLHSCGGGGNISTPTLVSITLTAATPYPVNPGNPRIYINVGATLQCSATGSYSDGTKQDLTAQVTWTSSNTSVATVNKSGLATGVSVGSATITATSGSISGNTNLTITAPVGTSPSGGIAIDASGNVWVVNGGSNTVTKLSPSGAVLGTFAVGTGPSGIAIDASGNVWITNYGVTELPPAADVPGNTVTELSSSGALLGTFTVGTRPSGIAIDASGNVWVVNGGSNTVTKLSPSGAVLGTFALGIGPSGIAIDASGNVWVANWGVEDVAGNTVTKLSPSGAVIGTFAVGTRPSGIAIDASGNVWITNGGSNNVTELSPAGTVLHTFSGAYFGGPFGIAIDASGNVWVVNAGGFVLLSNNVTVLSAATTGPQFWPYSGPVWP